MLTIRLSDDVVVMLEGVDDEPDEDLRGGGAGLRCDGNGGVGRNGPRRGARYPIRCIDPLHSDSSHGLFVDQVWWRNRDLAVEFAGVVGGQLGYPNIHEYGYLDPRLNWGPYFAYDGIYPTSTTDNNYLAVYYSNYDLFSYDGQANIVRDALPINFNAYFYAIATQVSPVPEPAGGLLLLTGLAAVAGRVGYRRKKVAA